MQLGLRTLHEVVAFQVVLLLWGCGGGLLPESEAAALIRESTETAGWCKVNLGTMQVKDDRGNWFSQSAVSSFYFETQILKWAEAGLISVAAEDVLSPDKAFNWQDWFARTQSGITKRVRTEATELGKELAELRDDEGLSVLVGECFKQSVEEIVSDDEIQVREDRFRVVQARVHRQPSELGETLKSVGGTSQVSGEYKLRLLLKWDAFEEHWVRHFDTERGIHGVDVAPIGQGFDTKYAVVPR